MTPEAPKKHRCEHGWRSAVRGTAPQNGAYDEKLNLIRVPYEGDGVAGDGQLLADRPQPFVGLGLEA